MKRSYNRKRNHKPSYKYICFEDMNSEMRPKR
jgi:hypothetical protein